MNIIQLIQLIVSLAPQGLTLTQEVLSIIQEIHGVIGALPTEHQQPVAAVAAKALVAKAVQ